MACADGVEQVLELSGRGRLDHACHQRVSVTAGVSQLRTARSAWGQLGAGRLG